MQFYTNNITNPAGTALAGLSVRVQHTDGSAATIYSDNGVTPATNPLVTDGTGSFGFYAANGRYQLAISGNGIIPYTVRDILLYDPASDETDLVGKASNADLANTANGYGADHIANAAKKVASIAALRALRVPQGSDAQTVIVDGQAEPFIYVAVSTAADDNGTVYMPNGVTSGQPGRWLRQYTGQLNLLWFGADKTGVTDSTAAIQAAINASNGKRLFAPAGKYLHGNLQVPKNVVFHLLGEFDSYNETEGTIFQYTGTGIGFQVGVDDGNPDTTGYSRSCRISHIHFTSTNNALTAIRMQNTSMSVIEKCRVRGFIGKIIDCRGNVLLKIRDNDIAGYNTGTGCYGIWLDDEYFGNFVAEISKNHIFQVNWACRFSEGRNLRVQENVIENIRNGTGTGGVFKFETSGYIGNAIFEHNYAENQQGWVFEGSAFTGSILNLIVRGNEFWGSADAANVNPGFGNLPKTKVATHNVADNFVVDAAWNAKAYLTLASVFPSTNIFDPTTTIITAQVTNKSYEQDLQYSLQLTELLKAAGDFADLTGGTAGTFTKTGGAPTGWTNLASPAWQLIADGIAGTFACYVPGAGDYDRCQTTVNLTPANRQRFFAIAFTTKGWAALRADGNVVYDSGANVANYHTEVVTFSVPANAASTTLKFGTNASNPFYIAEARLWEIGSAEYNEPGTMNNAVTKAVKRLMKRGAY